MKLHLCCGATYLTGYINCDIVGEVIPAEYVQDQIGINPNETTIDKYFKEPFNPDPSKRIRKSFIVDKLMDIKSPWPFKDESAEEIVMVSSFEHFEHKTEIPHIVKEAYRVLKPYGVWKFDFPDIKKQVDMYYGKNDEFLMELIYCNHKDKYSRHEWGYTQMTIGNYLNIGECAWTISVADVVKHDYPMTGIWAVKTVKGN